MIKNTKYKISFKEAVTLYLVNAMEDEEYHPKFLEDTANDLVSHGLLMRGYRYNRNEYFYECFHITEEGKEVLVGLDLEGLVFSN
jgi:hypothetical protein